MCAAAASLKRLILIVHRWMGVAFCLLFLLWFLSGIFMLYCDYPSVSRVDRLSHASALDPGSIRLSPQAAYQQLQSGVPPDAARIDMLDGRPAYRFRFGPDELIVYADNGTIPDEFPPQTTLRIASAWSSEPPTKAKVQVITDADQWTVSGGFEALRPLRKYSWPDGEQVYVSTVTGEVVQSTTRALRFRAFLGPIPHWLYFTPLRKRESSWSRVVIWASGLATVAAVLGITLGIWVYSPAKRYGGARGPSRIPYRGSKRWHMILGLAFGPLACTWAFSGMLSMDPFPQWSQSSDTRSAQLGGVLRGQPASLSAFDVKLPGDALLELGPDFHAKELELISFAASPVYLATAARNETRIVPMRGRPMEEFDQEAIVESLKRVVGDGPVQSRVVDRYEAYYLDRRNLLPLPAIFVQLNDARRSAFYIDPKTAQVIRSYDSRSRWNRWLYHGLHSLDFPWLYRHRPLWDIVVGTLLLGGAALCITSTLLAWGVARRNLRPASEGRGAAG